MEIRKIARKLEPFMPDDIAHWLRILDSADAKDKIDIERTIVYHATQVLGDYNKKMLLSLPPEENSKGAFELGTILYEKEKWPFALSENELLQNMAIFGRSGAGKTNMAFHLIRQLDEKRIPFLFLDWKRTARHLLPLLSQKVRIVTPGRELASFEFNPFVPPYGIENRVYANLVIDVLGEAFTLGDGSKSVMQKSLGACYSSGNHTPCVNDILNEIDKLPDKDRIRGWKLTATRALESLEFAGIGRKTATSQNEIVKTLLHGSSVIELDALSQGAKKFLIPLLCLWIYYVQLASDKREKLNLVVFIEEAHHILHAHKHGNESVMEMLLRQCREIGISIVVVDQHPSLISRAVLGNTFTTISLNLKDPSDISKASSLLFLDEDERHYLSTIPVGQAIIKMQDRWTRPFLIKIPVIEIQKGKMTDELLKQYILASEALSGFKSFIKAKFGDFGHFRTKDYILNVIGVAFVQDIVQYKYDGVDIRYKRLGLSAYKGTRLKDEFERAGFIESEIVRVGNTRRILLRLTSRAKELLGLEEEEVGERGRRSAESMLHEFWKHTYAEKFRRQGYSVELEASRPRGMLGQEIPGRADILATKASESVAVEIETGKSDAVWNVKQDLLARFRKILVVATDKAALEKVERELARAGLLGLGGRVELRLAGEKGAEGSNGTRKREQRA